MNLLILGSIPILGALLADLGFPFSLEFGNPGLAINGTIDQVRERKCCLELAFHKVHHRFPILAGMEYVHECELCCNELVLHHDI